MSEQQINTSKSKKKLYKKWWFWVAIAVALIIAVLALGSGNTNPKQLNMAEGEQVSVFGTILAIAQSETDGKGEITNYDCLALSKIALRNEGNFFSDDACAPGATGFIAKSTESAQSVVITIYANDSSGTIINCKAPTATFTFNAERTELVSYEYGEKECFQGVALPISDVDVKTLDEQTKYGEEHKYKHK